MDPEVVAAMARWPGVPRVRGWLRLGARGQWLLRGEPIGNEALRAFIGRNYQADAQGCWYFQNGPQRVDVELERAPWIVRADPAGWRTQVGTPLPPPRRVLLSDAGWFHFDTSIGPAALDDRDAAELLARLRCGGLPLPDDLLERWLAAGGSGAELPLVDAAAVTLDGVVVERIGESAIEDVLGFRRRP